MSNRFENVVNSVCSAIYAIAIIKSFSSSSLSSSVSPSSFTSTVCSQIPMIVEHALLRPAKSRILSNACIGGDSNANSTSSTRSSSSSIESESILSGRLLSSTWTFSIALAVVESLVTDSKNGNRIEEGFNTMSSLSSSSSSSSLNSIPRTLEMIATVVSGLSSSSSLADVENSLRLITPSLAWKERALELQKRHESLATGDRAKSSSSSSSSSLPVVAPSITKTDLIDLDHAAINVTKKSLLAISKTWALSIRKVLSDRVGPLAANSLGIRNTSSDPSSSQSSVSQNALAQSSSSSSPSSLLLPSLKYTDALQSVRRVNAILKEDSIRSSPPLPDFISLDDVMTSTLSDAQGRPIALSTHEYLFGRPLRSLEALCVRGTLHDRVTTVVDTLKKSMEVVAECAYSGPLHQYCEEDYYTDNNSSSSSEAITPLLTSVAKTSNATSSSSSSSSSPMSLRDGLRNASRRFENFGEALRRGENTAKHIEEAVLASSKSAADGGSRLGVTTSMEKTIRHTALPEALCGPAVYTAGIALLVAAGIVTVEDAHSRSSSSSSSSFLVRPTESARNHLGAHGLKRLFSRLPSSPSLDNPSSGLIWLSRDHAAWRKAGAESGFQSPFGACLAATSYFLAAELRAAFVDYAASAAVEEEEEEEEHTVNGSSTSNDVSAISSAVGFDERANDVIQLFISSISSLVDVKFGNTIAIVKANKEQGLASAYSAVFIGQFAASAHALLPSELLSLSSSSSSSTTTNAHLHNRRDVSMSSNAAILTSIASVCIESFAMNITSHAIEALQYNWALDGALLAKSDRKERFISYSSSPFTFLDAAASSAASLEWRSSHGSWMSAHVDGEGGAQVDVPVECSTGLGQSLARLSLHVKLLGLLDQMPLFSSSPLQLFQHLLSSSSSASSTNGLTNNKGSVGSGGGGTTTAKVSTTQQAASSNIISAPEIVSLLIELGLSPPFTEQYTVDPQSAHYSLMADGGEATQLHGHSHPPPPPPFPSSQQLPEMDESLRSLVASWAGTSVASTTSTSSSSSFLQASLASRAFRLSCQTAASCLFREQALKTYALISSSLAPPPPSPTSSSTSLNSTSSVCESAVLQAAYDAFILGHVLQPLCVAPLSDSAVSDTVKESYFLMIGLPPIWQNLSKRVFPPMQGKQPPPSQQQQQEGSPDPQSLYALLFNLIDPVERKLIEPRLISFASSSIKSHALSWARVAPSLAPQSLPGGLQLTSVTNGNNGDTWSLSALLGSSLTSGKGGASSSSSSSSSLLMGKLGLVRCGLSVFNSSSAILLSCPIPVSVISAEIEPTAVPLVPVKAPFQRITLLPTPTLSRPSTLSSSAAASAVLSSSSMSTLSSSLSSMSSSTKASGLTAATTGGRVVAPHETLISLLLRNSTPLSSSLVGLLSPSSSSGDGGKSEDGLGYALKSSGLPFDDDEVRGGDSGLGFAAAAEAAAAAAAVAAQKRQSGGGGSGSSGGVVAAAAKGLLQSVFELW